MTATCRSCGRLADAEAYFCPACGGDIAIKAESRLEPAADYTLKGAAFFAPATSTAESANTRFLPSPREANPASVPVELVIAQVIAGLVGLYFVLTNLPALPQSFNFALENFEFGALNLADTVLVLVVGGGFLYSISPLKKGEPFGRMILLTLSGATVVALLRTSWGPFVSLTPGQVLVGLGCVALAGLLVFSPKLIAHLAAEGVGAVEEVPDSVSGARTLVQVFAGLSSMVALALLPQTSFGWQQSMLGIVALGTAGIAVSLVRHIAPGDPPLRIKLSAAVVACYGAVLFSAISPFATTYLLAAGAGSLAVLWLGNASRTFFGDSPISYPTMAGGAMGFQKAAGEGMRAMSQLTPTRPLPAEPQVPLRLAEVRPEPDGEERDCRSLELAISAKTFLPYSWDSEPPRQGYVVTAQLTAPSAMNLNGFEEPAEQGFRGTSTLTLGSSGLMGVGVRGKSHAGAIDPKGTVIAWVLPYQTVSEVRVVVDESDQEVVILDLRSGGHVKMRKPRLLKGDSWENVVFTEFVATLRATIKRNSVVRAAPRAVVANTGSHPIPAAAPITPKGLVDEYLSTFKRFADFSSRSGRREFWVFTLANGVISFLLTIGWYMSLAATFAAAMQGGGGAGGFYLVSALFVGFGLITMVPGIAVMVRRLHDTGRSGILCLLSFIPLIGLVLIYFMILPSDPGDNVYGPMPN